MSETIKHIYTSLILIIFLILLFIACWIYRLASIVFKIQDLSPSPSLRLSIFYLTDNNNMMNNGINVRIICERNIVVFFVISVRNVIAHIFRNIQRELVATRRCYILFYIRFFF